jgi:hypothetical protein
MQRRGLGGYRNNTSPFSLWLVRNGFGAYLKSVDGHATARRDWYREVGLWESIAATSG